MARDLFIDLTNNRLAASETNLAPAAPPVFTKGDNGTFNLYFLQATGILNAPFTVVDRSTTSVKLGIGSRSLLPETGDYTLTFGANTTAAIPAAATAGQIATALNAIASVISAGGVTVTGALDEHFTIRFATAGTRGSLTADVSQVIPDTVAVIDERVAGSATAKEVAELQLRLTPAVFQSSWSNLSTTVTATIATTVTGSGLQNEIQRLTFSQKPQDGTYSLTFPATAFTVSSTVTAGVFITTTTHGLALSQPVTITGFDTTITGYDRITNFFVKEIPAAKQFTLSATAGGTAITGSATVAVTSGIITTIARQTSPIDASATAAEVQVALQSLDSIQSGGVLVDGIFGEFYDFAFSGSKGYADQPTITIVHGLTAKPGKTADVNFATFALRDLVGSDNAVDLDLEIELTDSGTRQTVILSGCSVSEELIDANAFSPVFSDTELVVAASTNTQNNVSLTNTHAGITNSAIVITAKGDGAFILGPKPDGTLTGGDARGANAVDLQVKRGDPGEVASGNFSAVGGGESNTASGNFSAVGGGESNTASNEASAVGGGETNTASGNYSAIGGGRSNTASGDYSTVGGSSNNTASGDYSAVGGGDNNTVSGVGSAIGGGANNTASGDYSAVGGGDNNTVSGSYSAVAGGFKAIANKYGQHAHAAGAFADNGDAQRSNYVLRKSTTNNTPSEMFLDGNATRLTLSTDQAIAFTAQIVGSRQGHADNAYFTRRGLVVNDGGTTAIVGSIETLGTDQKSAGASAASFAITADNTNDSIKFEITSITGQSWRWVASVDAVEVKFP